MTARRVAEWLDQPDALDDARPAAPMRSAPVSWWAQALVVGSCAAVLVMLAVMIAAWIGGAA